MSAGTLTLTNNTDAVTGTGTTFTTELVAGDFIVAKVGGITYTLPVKTVGSDTQVVLVSKYPGPTLSDIAWQAMPRESQNQVTAELVAQTTAALRGLNYDKQNWQAVFSASGDITVMLPDGSTFTGPSWKSLIDILNNIDIDAVQQLADQVRTDAQQVGSDKQAAEAAASSAKTDASAAASANSTAQTAKQDAETAAGTATDKATESKNAAEDAQTAKAAAEQAAAAVQPENLLHKDQNLDDLPDKGAARGHLDVYSKSEVYSKTESDTKSATTNARMAYALVDAGTISLNTRTVFNNPFGINTPVYVVVEAQISGKWAPTGWVTTVSGSTYYSYGLTAGFVAGEGIVIQSGTNGVSGQPSAITGGLHGLTNLPSASAPVRIHVWKITS
ncbi:TPA: hypothetical protein JAV82_004804 [Kluyvera ascorbata]|nr:hypothetical protein [Kluyvera ascorbata]